MVALQEGSACSRAQLVCETPADEYLNCNSAAVARASQSTIVVDGTSVGEDVLKEGFL